MEVTHSKRWISCALALVWSTQLWAAPDLPSQTVSARSHSWRVRHHAVKPKSPFQAVTQLTNWVFTLNSSSLWAIGGFACGGDINGDGYADLVLADAEIEQGRGRLLIFEGSADGLSAHGRFVPLDPAIKFDGPFTVSMIGDVNGDGLDDMMLVPKPASRTTNMLGPSWTLLGSREGPLEPVPFRRVLVVAGAGDVNGDGYDDVATLGEPPEPGANPQVWVHYGSPTGLHPKPDWVASSEQPNSLFGGVLARAGDVNGDGFDDLLVSATRYSGRYEHSGRVFLFYGSAHGLGAQPGWTAEYPLAVRRDVDEAYEQFFGWGLTGAGDVNGDGYDDVLIGACFADHNDINEGLAFLYLGSKHGLGAKPTWSGEGNQAHALFGQTVAAAGDVNGDGFGDFLVGAPQVTDGQQDEGAAVLYLGSRAGPARWPNWSMESDHSNEKFGALVQGAGDLNGDGYTDVVVLGPGYQIAPLANPQGRLVVCYGGPQGLLPSNAWRPRKPILVELHQEMDIYHRQLGSIVYWGPPSLLLATVSLTFLAIQRRLRRQLAAVVEENRQLAVTRERTRWARDVHDHLGAKLTQIALWTGIAQNGASTNGGPAPNLERVSELIKSAVRDVSQLVWTMNPANDTLENFTAYLCDYAAEFLEPARIELVLELPEVLPETRLAPDSRTHLFRAFEEVLNNVVRHAAATQVRLRIALEGAVLQVVVQDNGIGFERASGASAGRRTPGKNGLASITSRVEEVGGQVRICSARGQGTTVLLELPLTTTEKTDRA